MPAFYVGWFNALGKKPRRQLVTLAPIERNQLKPGIYKRFGRLVHVAWHTRHFGSIKLHLVTLTNQQLEKNQVNDLVKDALAFIGQANQTMIPAGEQQAGPENATI